MKGTLPKNEKRSIVRARLKRVVNRSGRLELLQADIQLELYLEDYRVRGCGKV